MQFPRQRWTQQTSPSSDNGPDELIAALAGARARTILKLQKHLTDATTKAFTRYMNHLSVQAQGCSYVVPKDVGVCSDDSTVTRCGSRFRLKACDGVRPDLRGDQSHGERYHPQCGRLLCAGHWHCDSGCKPLAQKPAWRDVLAMGFNTSDVMVRERILNHPDPEAY